jgi:hypothetical protein
MSGRMITPDVVEGEIMAFLRDELPSDSTKDSPIENWYRYQYLAQGHGFAPIGSVLVDFLDRNRERFDRVTEIGAAMGQNCVQLALWGWQTVAVECGALQYGLMERLLARLERLDGALTARIKPVKFVFPDRASEYVNERTLVCFLGGLLGQVDDKAVLEGIRPGGGLVLDLRGFHRLRESEREQEELINSITQLGFKSPVPFWDSAKGPWRFFPLKMMYFERVTTTGLR